MLYSSYIEYILHTHATTGAPLQDNGSILSFTGQICTADLCTHVLISLILLVIFRGQVLHSPAFGFHEWLSNENRMRNKTVNIHIDPRLNWHDTRLYCLMTYWLTYWLFCVKPEVKTYIEERKKKRILHHLFSTLDVKEGICERNIKHEGLADFQLFISYTSKAHLFSSYLGMKCCTFIIKWQAGALILYSRPFVLWWEPPSEVVSTCSNWPFHY